MSADCHLLERKKEHKEGDVRGYSMLMNKFWFSSPPLRLLRQLTSQLPKEKADPQVKQEGLSTLSQSLKNGAGQRETEQHTWVMRVHI